MGNISGNLSTAQYSSFGVAPLKNTKTCLKIFRDASGRSVYFGACIPTANYVVSSKKTGGDEAVVGFYSGCAGAFRLSPKVDDLNEGAPPHHTTDVSGYCQSIPFHISNSILRSSGILIITIIFGGLFVYLIVWLFNHHDGSNTAIMPTS